jgi:hypothetical protein
LLAEGNVVIGFAFEGIKSLLLLHPDFRYFFSPEMLPFFASLMEGEDYLVQTFSNYNSFLGKENVLHKTWSVLASSW